MFELNYRFPFFNVSSIYIPSSGVSIFTPKGLGVPDRSTIIVTGPTPEDPFSSNRDGKNTPSVLNLRVWGGRGLKPLRQIHRWRSDVLSVLS